MSKIITLFTIFLIAFGSFSADYFWIGGTGNWSDTLHWSDASGGTFVNTIPGAADNVIFDDNSGLTSTAITVTMDVAVQINDFDYSALTTAFTLSSALPSIEIQGSLLTNGLANITWGGDIILNTVTASSTVVNNGTIWSNDFYISGTEIIEFTDDFVSNNDFYVDLGGLLFSGTNFSVLNFYSNTTTTRSIDFTNAVLNVNGTNWTIDPTNITGTFTGSTINLTGTGTFSFAGGDLVYNDLNSSAADLEIFNDNTFSVITLATASTLTLENGSILSCAELVTTGDCFTKTTITTVNPSASATISHTGVSPFVASFLSLDNVDADISGGQVYSISLSDTTSSSNWGMAGTKFYWIDGSGNWSDEIQWSFNSNGAVCGCVPGPEDSVYFDASSFQTANDIVTVDQPSYFAYMQWTSTLGNPTILLNEDLYARGDVLLESNVLVRRSAIFKQIEFNRVANFDPQNADIDCFLSVNMEDELQDVDLISGLSMSDTSFVVISKGGLVSNGNSIATGTIQVFELPTSDIKRLDITGSSVNLQNSFLSQGATNFTFSSTGSELTIGNTSYFNKLLTNGLTFDKVNLNFSNSGGTNQQLGGDNTFNELRVSAGSAIYIELNSTQIINDSLIILGTCSDSISMICLDPSQPADFNLSTSNGGQVECLNVRGITASNALINALFSTDMGSNGTNWDFSIDSPTTPSFTAVGPYCFGDTTAFINNTTVISGNSNDFTSYWYYSDGSGYWQYNSPTDSTWINYAIDTLQHVFEDGGDFNVSLITEYTNQCKDTFELVVHINNPDVYLNTSENDTTICQGDLVDFSAFSSLSGLNYNYYINGTLVSSPASTFSTYAINHLDTVSVISEENGCLSPTEPAYVFVVNELPVFSWASSDADTTICYTDQVDFSSSAVDPTYTYRYLLNGLIETAYINPGDYSNATLNDQDTVSLVGLNSLGCTDTLSMIFTVHDLPIITMTESSGSNTICEDQEVIFTASGGVQYEFFVDGVSQGLQAGNTFAISTLQTGTVVSVLGYNIEGCQSLSSDTYSYTVTPLPNITISTNTGTSICSGTNVNVNSSGGSLYELFINGISQGAASPNNNFNLSSLADNDSVYVQGGFSGCTNNSDTLIFEVLQSPTTTLASSDVDQIICSGENVDFTATGATTYEFFVDGVSQGAPSTTNTFSSASIANGDIILVEGTSNTCSLSQSLAFTVLPSPTVSIFDNDVDNILCEGQSITFTGANAANYELLVNGVSQGAAQTSQTFNTILPTGLNDVVIVGTAANGCSDTSNVTSIQINPTPTLTLTSSDANNTICAGDEVTFTVSGGDSYQFLLNGISQGNMSANNTFTTSNLTNGDVIVVNGSLVGCSNTSNNIATTVNPVPNVSLTGTDVDNIFCEDIATTYTSTGATNYEFFIDGVSQGISTQNTLNPGTYAVGTYDIEVVGEANNCYDTNTVQITVNPVPVAQLNSSDLDNEICSGETVIYTANGGSLFEFLVNGNSQGSGSPLNTYTTSNLSDGDIISVIVSDANGCSVEEFEAAIVVNPTPVLTVTSSDPDLEICANDNIVITATGSTNYEFFLNGNSTGASSASNTYTSSTLADGDIVTVIGESNGCYSAVSTLEYIVNNDPVVSLTSANDTSLCAGELTDLTANGANTYQFFINGSSTGGFSTNANLSTTLSDGDMVYVVGESNGCLSNSLDTIYFSVFNYPNLFSVISNTSICPDEVVSINASGALSYDFVLNGDVQQSGLTSTYSISGLASNDIIEVIGYNGDCTDSDTYTISVNTMNLGLDVSPEALICFGDQVTFTGSGASQYEFFVNGVSQGASSTNNTFTSSTLTDLDQVNFIGYSSATGCFQTLSDTITIRVQNELLLNPNGAITICEGDSVVYSINADYGVQWFMNGSPIAGETNPTYTAYTTGTYSAEVTLGGNGEVWSFGNGASGGFGNGLNTNSVDPQQELSQTQMKSITAGHDHLLAVANSGELYAWGDNSFGQLGNGSFAPSNIAILVPSLTNIEKSAAANKSSYAVDASGNLYVWGDNNQGELGIGSTAVINFPFLNPNINSVDTICAGSNHLLVLKTDGTVWSSGDNAFGQLGLNSTTDVSTLTQIPTLANISAIGTGEYSSYAIDNTGQLYVWGDNSNGQLGMGDLNNRLIPTLSPLTNIKQVDGGNSHTAFVAQNGDLYAAGSNDFGEIGVATITSTTEPTVVAINGVEKVALGVDYTLAMKSDHSVYGFGTNSQGQLSTLGTTVGQPTIIPTVEGVTDITAFYQSSHFIFGVGQTCQSDISGLTVLPVPVATITADADTLTASAGASYQWYLNGLPIPGATSQVYEAQAGGVYSVEVTYSNGCSSLSESITHSMTSIDENQFVDIKIYPNPTKGQLIIDTQDTWNTFNYSIKDMSGREIFKGISTDQTLIINLEKVEAGIYYICLSTNDQEYKTRVVKQ